MSDIRFRVIYDPDDPALPASYTHLDGPPQDAPADGVIAIRQTWQDSLGLWKAELEHGRDYFVWTDHGWRNVDLVGVLDYMRRPGWKKVLFGRLVENAVYQRTVSAALREPLGE